MCIQRRFFPCKDLFRPMIQNLVFRVPLVIARNNNQSGFIYYLHRYIKIILTVYKLLQSDKRIRFTNEIFLTPKLKHEMR